MTSNHDNHEDYHSCEGGGHANHEEMFRRKFWISTLLSFPVLIFSETQQGWLGYSISDFPLSNWITPLFRSLYSLLEGCLSSERQRES
jgi:Cu2+-exporting ATPase